MTTWKMFFHIVLLASLSWPLVSGDADLQTVDQIATASENAAQTTRKPEGKDIRDQLITSIIDTTVHYENSKGFRPMNSSSKPPDLLDSPNLTSNITLTNSLSDHDNSSVASVEEEESLEQETGSFEDDPAYSSEARIFLNFAQLRNNRRSFEYQGGQNDFELLKVKNNTPVVANYPNFYEDPPSSSESEKTHLRHRVKGKAMDDYTGNYGIAMPANHNAGPSYVDYYSRESGRDKKLSHEREKVVASNYHQQSDLSYDSHGQPVSPTPSLPRTNQEVNDLAKGASNSYDAYDSVATSSQVSKSHQRFTRPVVVAEPSYQFDQSSTSNFGSENYQTSRVIDSGSSELSSLYTMNNRNGRFRSEEDSRDMSEEPDYVEYSERPRRVQKSRRRPSSLENSRKLPKEHRGSTDDSLEYESQSKRHHSRGKSHRQRVRGNSWMDDDHDQGDSYEEVRYDDRFTGSESRPKSQHSSKFKSNNGWKQVSPNLEISHSSGVEIGQLEKPKLIVPVNVNLLPLANFDHATAIGNSQGFDMSNVLLPVSTPTPLVTTPERDLGQESKIRVSSPVPDIIVGHNNFQNSMQVVPQINDQSRFPSSQNPQYVSSTIAPIYAVTPSISPGVQTIPIQDVQGTTPRPSYINQVQQAQGNLPQLIVPQPTVQTVPTLLQTPFQSNFNIQVNPHGMHGQNFVNHGNLQVQSIPAVSTVTPASQPVPVTKINLVTAESQSKKTLVPGSTANFLASASLAVGQNDQRQQLNGNSYYLQSSNSQHVVKPQIQNGMYQQVAPKSKTYIQTTHLLPAVLHSMPTLATFAASTPQVIPDSFVKIPTPGFDSVSTLKSIRVPPFGYQTIDTVGSQSTATINTLSPFPSVSGAENAHLPYVGTRNVEIVNPNIKPSPVDTNVVNAYNTIQYPAAVLTTPIPVFTTTSLVTARPLLPSSTESTSDMKAYQSQDRPVFNPINFVPNIEVVKNQNALNNKLHATEPLQQNLNLVPLIPGGNFFKPSFSAQSDLLVKPKLTSDLETYAEQMFKESLKTIYNSQRWNNDRKPGNRHNASDTLDLNKLKNELQRLKASFSESKRNKDQVEGNSETKLQTAELLSKKPDELLAALEQMLKTHPTESFNHHGSGRPHRHRRPGDQEKLKFGASSDFRDTKPFRDFPNSGKHYYSGPHRPKGHFHDKPGKKRPTSTRFNRNHFHGPRSHPRHGLSPKSGGLETSATNFEPVLSDSPHFDGTQDSRHRPYSDFKKSSPFDSYPSLTTSLPDNNGFHKASNGGREQGINHPRMHNLLGLMMKNKQLPVRDTSSNYFREDQIKQFFENEKQRTQQQFYDRTLKDYFFKMPEGTTYSTLGYSGSDTRRSLPQKSGV